MIALRRKSRAKLKIHRPIEDPGPDLGAVAWFLDGHPMTIELWSAEVVERLQEPPEDAQRFPGGCWGRVRV